MARPAATEPRSGHKVGLTETEKAEVLAAAQVEGVTLSRFLREAGLAHARRQPLSETFLRGLQRRAPTGGEVELLELAWLARRSRLPQVRAESQAQLVGLIHQLQATAARRNEAP